MLDEFGDDFDNFVKDHKNIVDVGEGVIKEIETTGFNVSYFLDEDDFPFESNEYLIFYNNYVDIPEHFGILLTEMEKSGIITEDQIEFSKKATEVIVGEWSDTNMPTNVYTLERKDGSKVVIGRSVETMIRFSTDEEQAPKIIEFLVRKATKIEGNNYIPGSFEDPDIRITQGLANTNAMERINYFGLFEDTVSNVKLIDDGKLVVLRKSTKFEGDDAKKSEGWKSYDTPVNKQLAQYIQLHGVKP